MYINKIKINKAKIMNTIKLVIGIVGLIIFGTTLIAILLDDGSTGFEINVGRNYCFWYFDDYFNVISL